MKPNYKINSIFLILSLAFLNSPAQQTKSSEQRLKIFIECSSYDLCNQDCIRKEVTITDFVRDPYEADVHVIVVSELTGGGGEKNTMTFIGQAGFANRKDTMAFFTANSATTHEKRIQMIRLLKLGLIPFLITTSSVDNIEIQFTKSEEGTLSKPAVDKWKSWVFNVGGRGNLRGDKNYKQHSFGMNLSAGKVTEAFKTNISFYKNQSRNVYRYEENEKSVELKTSNNYTSIDQDYIKSLSPKWSVGYEANYKQSTYDNYRHLFGLSPGIEYNIFPYNLSSSKFLVLRYRIGAEKRVYFEKTLFDKSKELLFSNDLGAYASFIQKWGSVEGSLTWQNYLHDFSKNKLSLNVYLEIRLFKGLSLYCFTHASIIRDQLNVGKQDANQQEVLLQLKALTTSYNYNTGFGINYSFGSSFNNVVNARFTNGRMY